MIAQLLSSILSLVAVVLMFIIVKSGYEAKDKMLRLFQFGYMGLLIFNFIGHATSCLDIYTHSHNPARWHTLNYMTEILNFSVLVPYLIHEHRKAKALKQEKIF